MCGICGSFSFRRLTDEDIATTTQLVRLMERRGPDDDGLWTDRKHCVLGFRRLTILDLSPAGHQPMTTPDGRYTLVYNGEVYNFPELRKDLEEKGIHFKSSGDTEVVLNALALWGKEALSRFNGMFALALFDRLEKRLLLARDHAGIKPLYYLLAPEGLAFASQYDQILAHPWAKRAKISREALGLYLRLGYIPAPYALLNGTYMVEPGAWVEVDSAAQVSRGKFFEFPRSECPDLSSNDAYEAVDEAITRAVQRHLVSDVPVGAFLSGGIDSPLVVAKMRSFDQGQVHAFTVGTQGDDLDESTDAMAYARELGVEQTVEHVSPELALKMLDEVVTSCGEPFADYSIFPTMVIARLARRHVKVILSGDGGDELFWGYPSRFVPLLKHSDDFLQPQWLRNLQWYARRLTRTTNGNSHLYYKSIGECYLAAHGRIAEDDLLGLFPDVSAWPNEFPLFAYNGCEVNATAQWLRWNEFVGHLTMVLLKVDRASMYHSLEVRVPLLDREVINIAARVDWHSCLDLETRIGKYPLRHSLARHVHRPTQAKRGFEVPMGSWLKGPLKETFHETVVARREILGLKVERKKLARMLQRHTAGHIDYTKSLWTLLSLALWEKRHYRASYADNDYPSSHRSNESIAGQIMQ